MVADKFKAPAPPKKPAEKPKTAKAQDTDDLESRVSALEDNAGNMGYRLDAAEARANDLQALIDALAARVDECCGKAPEPDPYCPPEEKRNKTR